MTALIRALSIGAATAVLAGCGGSQFPAGPPGALPQTGAVTRFSPPSGRFAITPAYDSRPQNPDHTRSWMRPGTSKIQELLYVSDHHTNDVYVYDYQPVQALVS